MNTSASGAVTGQDGKRLRWPIKSMTWRSLLQAITATGSADQPDRAGGSYDDGLSPNSQLQLYPLLIRQDNSRDYSILRLGCPTVTVVSTTIAGADACRLLRRGLSLRAVSDRLIEKFGAGAADLDRLLAALRKARMIRSIDGRVLEPLSPTLGREWRQRLQWLTIRLRAYAVRISIRALPVAWSYALLWCGKPKWSRAKQKQVRNQAIQNLRQIFAGSLSLPKIHSVADAFVSEQIRRDIDLEYLAALPEYRVGCWLRRCTKIEGIEHLDRAIAAKKGVILSGFHFSSSHLIALILWLHGYSFIGAGGITLDNRDRQLPFENKELMRRLGGCGQVTWFNTFTLRNALLISRALGSGGMALVFPDGFFTRPKGEVAEYFGNSASQYRRAQTVVPFLGRMAEANTGVPWIYQQSCAQLLPVKLERESNHRFRLLIGPPDTSLDRSASLPEIAAQFYRLLEREIALDPGAWAYWRVVDRFTAKAPETPESANKLEAM